MKDVIFESPVQCTIGANAFKTQDATIHQTGCTNQDLSTTPELTFTGDISYASGPFDYAMTPSNNINVGSQERTYIKFYSGWPTNLTVQYNPNTDKNELVDYPILEDLANYNMDSYPYMTEEYLKAANEVANKLKNGGRLTDYEQQIADSALNIVLPQGIESVKENLFVEKEAKESQNVEKSITTNSIAEILPGTFKGCTNLKTLNIWGDTSSIGDYAFEGCTKLETVEISENVNHMGKRPFAGCPNVTNVSFQGGSNFVCEDSIIYGLNDGSKSTIVECLEARGNFSGATSVKAEELAGITGIAEEAFYDCSGVGSVDLSQSSIDKIPPYAFAASEGSNSTLYSVYLPKTCQQIQKNAFKNSAVRYLEIPGSVSYIDLDAFNTDRNSPKDAVDEDDGIVRERPHSIDFYCEPGSAANIYASNHENINISDKPIELEFKVTFGVVNPTDITDVEILDTQTVKGGEDAVPPTPPEFEGYTFQGWYPDYHAVARDLDVVAQYKANDPEDSKLTVIFMDEDGVTELGRDSVFPGEDAKPPVAPDKEGYRFIGWVPAYTNITEDTTVYARYERVDSDETRYIVNFYAWNTETGRNDLLIATQRIAPGEKITDPRVPDRPGYRFTGWLPDVSNVTSNVDTYAQYDYAGQGAPTP
ncbi:MAG: leucine-rich repeat protein, partial [Acetatifactor sp.]|nr:leucine-rich repeat protein [Acetatifactor sp.]